MIQIPSGVFTKYAEVADSMLTTSLFGVPCKLIYLDKIEVIEDTVPDIKSRKTMNPSFNSPNSVFKHGNTNFRSVETSEDITLRVYWTKKDFIRFGNIEVPDGSIMTISAYSSLQNINRAIALVINTDKTDHQEWKFEKIAEPTIHGLDNNYIMCYWSRTK